LWLEMRLPDRTARGSILARHLRGLEQLFPQLDHEAILDGTDGFTGADLKRVVEDAKGLYAYARVGGNGDRSADDYLREAVQGVSANKARYVQAQESARADSVRNHAASWGQYH